MVSHILENFIGAIDVCSVYDLVMCFTFRQPYIKLVFNRNMYFSFSHIIGDTQHFSLSLFKKLTQFLRFRGSKINKCTKGKES